MMPDPQRPVQNAGLTWSFFDERSSANELTLGFRFQSAVPGFIVQAAWLQNVNDDRVHCAQLSTELGVLKKVQAFMPSITTGGETEWSWVRRNIKPGWKIDADTIYEWAVFREVVMYAAAPHTTDSAPLTVGDITIIQNNSGAALSTGLFTYDRVFSPDTFFRGEGTVYGVDFGFQPF